MRSITNINLELTQKIPYTEKELFNLISEENHEAFQILLDRHRSNIFGHAMMLLKDPYKAQDIVQDVFLHIWEKRATLPAVVNPENYLFIIARNKVVSAFRKKILLPIEDEMQQIQLAGSLAPDQKIENKQLAAHIQDAIDQMPPQRKIVFELCKKEGLKYDEIAAKLSISPNTVKVHMTQAFASIRQFLKEKEPTLLILCHIQNYFPYN